MSDELKSLRQPDAEQTRNITSQRHSLELWIQTVWTLVAHTILSIVIPAFVLVGIKDRPFNIVDHFAPVQTINGTETLPFALTQSDIITILSAMIVAHRWALLAWVVPLCWRIAIFLMEKRGLAHQDFEALIRYRSLTPRTYLKNLTTLFIGTLLLTSLAANISTPLLTGAISWVPKDYLAHGLSTGPVTFRDIEAGPESSGVRQEILRLQSRLATISFSVGMVNLGWGRDPEKGVLRRINTSIGALAVNSTIKDAVLPFFKVHSVEWIQNVEEIPNFPTNDQDMKGTVLAPLFLSNPTNITWTPFGEVLLIPNGFYNWSRDPMNSTIVNERRLIFFSAARDIETETSQSYIYSLTKDLPANTYLAHESGYHYAFAWVTFSAGVGRCKEYKCVVSPRSTVRNDTPIELEPHPLTSMALSMVPSVSIPIVAENSSIPYPWTNINDYVEAILVRSYSAAWSYLNLAAVSASVTSYAPSLPGLVADVDIRRVYVWLGIQLFVTLLSIAFLALQTSEPSTR